MLLRRIRVAVLRVDNLVRGHVKFALDPCRQQFRQRAVAVTLIAWCCFFLLAFTPSDEFAYAIGLDSPR